MTARLAATMGGFLLVSAVVSGVLSDRLGRIPLLAMASGLSAAATVVLILAPSLTVVFVTGCFFGLAVGAFMSTHWALGTDLAPSEQGGLYLGIANLAGAGAGIVGTGIGGPLADLVNGLHPGLGYLVIFGIDGGLFGLSILALTRIRQPAQAQMPSGSEELP
jgi:MFS family permease